jgi:hypothetical protein
MIGLRATGAAITVTVHHEDDFCQVFYLMLVIVIIEYKKPNVLPVFTDLYIGFVSPLKSLYELTNVIYL